MSEKEKSGTWNWSIDPATGTRLAEEFKAQERAKHQERLKERAIARKLARGEVFDELIGPPDPRKLWKWRPPMRR